MPDEPGFAFLSHCRDCQRQSGSAYAAGWRLPAAGFRVTSGYPSRFRPEANIFTASAQPWDHRNPDLPKYPASPLGRAYEAAS